MQTNRSEVIDVSQLSDIEVELVGPNSFKDQLDQDNMLDMRGSRSARSLTPRAGRTPRQALQEMTANETSSETNQKNINFDEYEINAVDEVERMKGTKAPKSISQKNDSIQPEVAKVNVFGYEMADLKQLK